MSLLPQRLLAESLGTALLLATVVGSGVMGVALADGNDAVALLANAGATAGMLYVLITILGPISGAHFNPAVTLAMALRGELPVRDAAAYVPFQLLGALTGVLLTILLGARHRLAATPVLVAAYIFAAYWFTSSTSFANPAVTLARALTTTFAGIRPEDVLGFVLAQFGGVVAALAVARVLDTEARQAA